MGLRSRTKARPVRGSISMRQEHGGAYGGPWERIIEQTPFAGVTNVSPTSDIISAVSRRHRSLTQLRWCGTAEQRP
jgi:hypothetical protein